MKRIEKFELMYTKFSWFLIFICVHIAVMELMYTQLSLGAYFSPVIRLVFLLVPALLNFIKIQTLKRNLFSKTKYYYVFRILEPLVNNFIIVIFGLEDWAYIIHIFLILITCVGFGRKPALLLTAYAYITNTAIALLFQIHAIDGNLFLEYLLSFEFFNLTLIYLMIMLFALLCGKIYDTIDANEVQNTRLFAELANRYDQLTAAQEEIKIQNEKLKDTNSKMEEANKKLRDSLAELFTVQQVIQAISSIFDIKELLRHVNDIIIGVMGVNNSTIILYDEKKSRLKVNTTTITNRKELISLYDNINCDILMSVINTGEPILENFVDKNKYLFTQDREVNSLICVPLINKSQKYGLVLIEHKYSDAFDEGNLRLLNTIGQQVGIALENVELYQKMHELATIDSLTGIYNRLYFQERLSKEIELAQKEQYELSLAIFDIDYFKRFNDTYGHLFGDKVLKHIAELIKNSLRSRDILARFGGEEFVILLPRTGINEACEKVENLRKIISGTVIKDDLITASVTVSFGVSSYPEYSNNEGELLRTADNALYDAKKCGRNCVRVPKDVNKP